jgi:addiction module HigA family antidote
MSSMYNPPHPGETLREDVLPHLNLTVTQAAQALGVTRAALSRVLNGRAAISSEMALRLERWLGADNGGSADAWVAQQAAYDLWHARREVAPKIAQIKKVRRVQRRDQDHALAKSSQADTRTSRLEHRR